jgi:hypothetical protein
MRTTLLKLWVFVMVIPVLLLVALLPTAGILPTVGIGG